MQRFDLALPVRRRKQKILSNRKFYQACGILSGYGLASI
jgi:hypothetical protein